MREPSDRRPYRQRARAASTEATGRRIVDAALASYETVGPARTTISRVAETAGVERLTVYRHFPTEEALAAACAATIAERHPPPGPALDDPDPVDRLVRAVEATHDYYLGAEPLVGRLRRDASLHPPTGRWVAELDARLARLAAAVAPGWASDPARGPAVRAAIGLALSYETWLTLTRVGGLDRDTTVDLLVGLVEAAAEPLS